jgi:hypothetical protein
MAIAITTRCDRFLGGAIDVPTELNRAHALEHPSYQRIAICNLQQHGPRPSEGQPVRPLETLCCLAAMAWTGMSTTARAAEVSVRGMRVHDILGEIKRPGANAVLVYSN